MLSRCFGWIITMLIRHAMRTPYYHLTGYMDRFWLVPYSEPIARTVRMHWHKAWPFLSYEQRGAWIDRGEIDVDVTFYDGTGPLDWLMHPIGRLIQKLGYAVRIHHILRSDHGREPHDHPWPYLTIILRGGYWESLFDSSGNLLSKKWHGPGSALLRKANTWHRLDVPPGMTAWTLFITGEKKQTWGFNVDGKKVDRQTYKQAGGMQ
jgi:hypothetical protein